MVHSRSTVMVRAESGRWLRDATVVAVPLAAALAAAALTYFAILVAAGVIASGTSGVQIETDTLLSSSSGDKDVASLLHSSLVLILPIAGVGVGARFAGSEMSSGALLTLAVATRRLRALIVVRVIVLTLVLVTMAIVTTAAVCSAGSVALAQGPAGNQLSAWTYAGALTVGALVQSVTIGVWTFSLAALTRRWVPVVIGAIVYIVALEPVIQSLVGEDVTWLPRTATSALVAPDAEWLPVLPTTVIAISMLACVIGSLRRDRAFR